MTLALTFPIRDAWVVIADKKMISKEDNIKDSDLMCIKFFTDNRQKIEKIAHGLIFVGAGNKDILDKTIERINLSKDFDEFLKYLKEKIGEVYSHFGDTINEEEFLIIEQNKQRAFKFKIKEIKRSEGKKGCYPLIAQNLENNFIGCYENCINLGNVKLEINQLRTNISTSAGKKFYQECNRILSLLAIDNLYSVGHPAIHGSDIWLVSNNKIKKVYSSPANTYLWEVKEDD